MNLLKYKNIIIITVISIFLILFINYSNNLNRKEKIKKAEILKAQKLENTKKLLDNLSLEAKAVSIYDATLAKFFYGRNENQILPIASLTKIATAMVVLGDDSINEVEITPEDLKQFGDNTLKIGEKWQKRELLSYALISSSNDAIHALGSGEEFVKKLNDYVKSIDLKNTSFRNSTGLDIWPGGQTGAESNAKEINLLSVRAWRIYPDIFTKTTNTSAVFESITGSKYEAVNTNLILASIPNMVFSKTGYTTLAGGSLVIIFKNTDQHYYAITILGSTREGRFSDMQKIVNVLYNENHE